MTEQNFSRPLAESISALVDNQASELELQRILKASQTDPEVRATWERYQITSAVLRRDMPAFELGDFASRVSAAIAEEETHQLVESQDQESAAAKRQPWWQNMARFAVAASVAGGVILFAQNLDQTVVDAPEIAAAASSTAPVILPPSVYQGQLRTVGMQNGYDMSQEQRQIMFVPRQTSVPAVTHEELVEYFNELVEVHADHAALNSGQGLLPFARVVLTEED
jgi:sigma-E factor negative regulatory protein RseA